MRLVYSYSPSSSSATTSSGARARAFSPPSCAHRARAQDQATPALLSGRFSRARVVARAANGEGFEREGASASMDLEKAREMFGVPKEASFDDVLSAKKKLQASSDLEQDVIDAAYDRLLMDSLRSRQEGRVSKDVRYADVPKAKPVSQVANELLQKLPGNVQVSVGSRTGGSPREDATAMERVGQAANPQNIIFTLLVVWIFAQAASSPPNYPYDSPSTQIAAAVIASLYFQRQEKGLKLGRAVAITFGGLLVGTLVGSAVEAVVKVDVVPLLGVHSPAMVVGEFSVIGVWLACAFLL